jgi:Predicted ATPases
LFIDWNRVYSYGTPEDVYSRVVSEGGGEAIGPALKILQAEYGELLAVIQARGNWALHAVFKDEALPYYALGIKYALIHLMVLHAPKDAVLLVEELELHTRPSLIRLVARSIISSVAERGDQVFVATHSLELIEMLVEGARERGLDGDSLKICRLVLKDGILDSEVYTLPEAYEAVERLKWDLGK